MASSGQRGQSQSLSLHSQSRSLLSGAVLHVVDIPPRRPCPLLWLLSARRGVEGEVVPVLRVHGREPTGEDRVPRPVSEQVGCRHLHGPWAGRRQAVGAASTSASRLRPGCIWEGLACSSGWYSASLPAASSAAGSMSAYSGRSE